MYTHKITIQQNSRNVTFFISSFSSAHNKPPVSFFAFNPFKPFFLSITTMARTHIVPHGMSREEAKALGILPTDNTDNTKNQIPDNDDDIAPESDTVLESELDVESTDDEDANPDSEPEFNTDHATDAATNEEDIQISKMDSNRKKAALEGPTDSLHKGNEEILNIHNTKNKSPDKNSDIASESNNKNSDNTDVIPSGTLVSLSTNSAKI